MLKKLVTKNAIFIITSTLFSYLLYHLLFWILGEISVLKEINVGSITLYSFVKFTFIIIMVVVSLLIANGVIKRFKMIINTWHVEEPTKSTLGTFTAIGVYVATFFVLLGMTGVDLKYFSFLGGAIGIGVGLGLQKIASSFVSGIILSIDKSIKVGDIVELQNGIVGKVAEIGMRYSVIKGFDGKEVLVPNEHFIIESVVNWTHSSEEIRADFFVSVAYDSDIEKVEVILQDIANNFNMSDKFKPFCAIEKFDSSAIEFVVSSWYIRGFGYDSVKEFKSRIAKEVIKEFKNAKIVIPYNQVDVNIKNDEKM